MWKDPENILYTLDVYPKGKIYIGHATYGGGQVVGTAPVMARLEIPLEVGVYPKEWFEVGTYNSAFKVKLELEKELYKGKCFIPHWFRADCFEYFYRRLVL